MLKTIKKFFKYLNQSYAKIAINFVLINSILMMWCSYVLAWFDKISIAESLSSTVADVIVGTIIAYLCTKTIENVSKYGSRLNGTAKEDVEEVEAPIKEEDVIELKEEEKENMNNGNNIN